MVSVRAVVAALVCLAGACGSGGGGKGTAAYVDEDRLVIVDVESGDRRTVELPFPITNDVEIAPDAHAVAVASQDALYIVDLDDLSMREITPPPVPSSELRWGAGRYLLYDAGSPGSGEVRVLPDGETNSRALGDVATEILLSPFDSTFAYVDYPRDDLVVESASGDRHVVLALAHDEYPTAVAFLPDGDLLFTHFVDGARRLERWSNDDDSFETIAVDVFPVTGARALDPDATRLLLHRDDWLRTLSLSDGEINSIVEGGAIVRRPVFLPTGAVAFETSLYNDSVLRCTLHVVVGDDELVLDESHEYDEPEEDPYCDTVHSRRGRVAAWGADGRYRIYSLDDGTPYAELPPDVTVDSFDRDDTGVVFSDADGPIKYAATLEYMTLDGEITELGVGWPVDYVP